MSICKKHMRPKVLRQTRPKDNDENERAFRLHEEPFVCGQREHNSRMPSPIIRRLRSFEEQQFSRASVNNPSVLFYSGDL